MHWKNTFRIYETQIAIHSKMLIKNGVSNLILIKTIFELKILIYEIKKKKKK